MAKFIAREIKTEVNRVESLGKHISKISMIGHSLGGIVIRACLKYLVKEDKYKQSLYMLMTLGTPHIGYIHSNSSLLSTGMWLVDKLTKNSVISQIRLSDSNDIKQTALYKLAKDNGISNFKKVIMVGSTKDTYAPYESAGLQKSDRIK